jgi:site-specific DNA recombinase
MKTVGIYARVSTGRQEQERTIESQVKAIEQHVAAMGATIDPEHRYLDDGWSGATLRRPGLDALRDAIAQERLDCVVLYDADRLARRFVDQQIVLDELLRKGVELVLVNGGVARTDEERMALAVRGVFAEYERAKILDRTRRGRLHRARSGVPPAWAKPPYGYRYLLGTRHEPGTVLVEECEAAIVREIFTWVANESLPLRQVAQRLEQRGVASRSGGRWNTSTLSGLVRNSVYMGLAHHHKVEAVEPQRPRNPLGYRRRRKSSFKRRPQEQWIGVKVPALVDAALFDRAQACVRANRRRTAGQAKHGYLLRGLLICAACGRTLWARTSDPGQRAERRYYTCSQRDRFSARDATPCPHPPLRVDEVDPIVWQDLERWLQEPEQLAAQLDAQQEKVSTILEAYEGERRRLLREAKSFDAAISRLVDAYQAGALSLEELRTRRERLEESKHHGESLLATWRDDRSQALQRRNVIDELRQLQEQLRDGLARCTWEDRRAIVELLVEKIVVTETKLQVHYIVPLEPSASRPSGRGGTLPPATEPSGGLCQPCPHAHERRARGRRTADGRRQTADDQVAEPVCPKAPRGSRPPAPCPHRPRRTFAPPCRTGFSSSGGA